MRESHGLGANEADDFTVRNQTDLAETAQETTEVMTLLLAAIASISLLVGGIGIMNIMLVSVTERTREIGLRMALGARGSDVLTQFLVESVVMSVVGGLLGVGLGLAGGEVLVLAASPAGARSISPASGAAGARFRRGGRRLLRLLPGAAGGGLGPHRGAALRVSALASHAERTIMHQVHHAVNLCRERRVAGLMVATLAAACLAPAAGGAELQRVTFADAVQMALERGSALQRARNTNRLDDASLAQARASFWPDLRLSASAGRDWGRYFDDTEGRILDTTSESFSAGLSSSVVLFDGLGNLAELRQAELERQAGRSDVARARQTAVFAVITGYLALIEADEQVRVREEDLAAQREQEAQVQALVEGGARPISDLYQQRATVAAARLTLVQARRTAELSRVDLVQGLQLDPLGDYEFVPPALPEIDPDAPEAELAPLLERAFRQREDLRAQVVRLEALGQAERAAGAARWPSLTLSGRYGSNWSSNGIDSFLDQLEQRRGGSVGLGISLPIFDRKFISRSIQQASVASENARIALRDLRQAVALDVRRALLDGVAAREGLAAAEARYAAAAQAQAATQERYRAGVATLLEVTQARADLVAAASDRVRARYSLLWQQQQLGYHVGDLEPEGLS